MQLNKRNLFNEYAQVRHEALLFVDFIQKSIFGYPLTFEVPFFARIPLLSLCSAFPPTRTGFLDLSSICSQKISLI